MTADGGRDGRAVSIVGIGASAGGLAALKTFFSKVPPDSGLAFVVVIHLAPGHESHLAEILQPHARVPVRQVTEAVPIERDHVYIIPPGSYLGTVDTHLRLSALQDKRHERGPIDHFFRTLAATHDGEAVGVILSGTGSDGTLGIKAVKEHGGLTVVQDPDEAEFDGMPRNAIATGLVDLVLPVAAIPERVIRISRLRPAIAVPADGNLHPEEERLLESIFALLRGRTRRDFSRHKRSTILRRIQRRMQLRQVERLEVYAELLRDRPDEALALADEFLITVTSFFRDADVFSALEERVIPALLDDKGASDQVRAWSCGCATGEEAYSVAMVLLEAAARRDVSPRIQVFASDLHERSLKIAREGRYTGNIEADVSSERVRRFFERIDGGEYRIRDEVRERVVFAQHNVLADPPFSKLDLIVCRNLLIYLERDVQREVIALFHYALNPDGFLVLGKSEMIEEANLFSPEDKAHGIHRKRNTRPRESRLPVFLMTDAPAAAMLARAPERPSGVHGELHQRVVERYAPPSILVGPDHRVVHVSENAGRYLRMPGGEATMNVLSLVREELRLDLHAALRDAETRTLVQSKPIPLRLDGEPATVVLIVRRALEPPDDGAVLLVMFVELAGAAELPSLREPPAAEDDRARGVRADLERTKERLQALVGEQETGREEMRAANEELLSANEELRSTMEELETSREELQSMNEELVTVNQENRHRVEELNQLSSDLQNLMVATDIATLFLDRELRIVRFTPRLDALFNVRAGDRGRPLSDLTHRLRYDALTDDARQVLERLTPVERELQDEAGQWYLARMLPYRAAEDRIGGVVATFVDITAQKRAAAEIAEAKRHAESVIDTIDEPLLILTPDLRVSFANRAFYAHFNVQPAATVGRLVYSLGNGQWDIPALRTLLEDVLPENHSFDDYEVAHHFSDVGERVILVNARRLDDTQLILLGFRDITGLKRVEHALREADRRKDEFLATLAHELRNPLAAISGVLAAERRLDGNRTPVAPTRGIIERQTAHLVRLVDDLMDLSRITRGKVELLREPIDLRAVARNAVDTFAALVDAAQCEITIDAPPDPVIVEADAVRIAQVISNLLSNAVKFTPQRCPIVLTVGRQSGTATLAVRDTGIGIPPEMLPHVFEAFVQVDSSTTKMHGGLGIGLTLVRTLTELHGGTVEARSAGTGQGSEFVVRLPLASAAVAQPAEASATGPPGAVPPPPAASRILVVDDNRDAADAIALLLRMQGHEAEVAYDGEAALAAIERFRPALAFVDLGMPDMDGYEVARRVRAHGHGDGITLVALTGWGQEDVRRRAADAGFDRHLVKPVAPESLDALLATVLPAGA